MISLLKIIYFYFLGQVSQHVPAPQVQNLGTPIPNMQPGLVPPPAAVNAQSPIEEVQQQQPQPPLQQQQPLDDSGNDVHVDSGYNEEPQEIEPEIPEQQRQEPGKILYLFIVEVDNLSIFLFTVSNEPKTYATLLKSGSNNSNYTVNQSNFSSQPPKSLSPVSSCYLSP